MKSIDLRILPEARKLKLHFTPTNVVDFNVPRCTHCWSRNFVPAGLVIKGAIDSNNPQYRFDCQCYYCIRCDHYFSPILDCAFIYDAQQESIKRLEKLEKELETDLNDKSNIEHLGRSIGALVNSLYVEHLNLPIGKNAIYHKSDLANILIKSIIDGQCPEMSSTILNLPGSGAKAPSADTLFIYLGKNTESDMRKNIRTLFDIVNDKASALQWYDTPHPVAIDFHDEPYYGKERQKAIHTSKEKTRSGSSYVFKYATVDIVFPNHRLTVIGQHLSQFDEKITIFKEILEYTLGRVKVSVLLIDREFFTVKILQYLLRRPIPIPHILPAIKNERVVKEAKLHYDRGEYVFPYHLGKKGDTDGVDITLFTIRNEDYDPTKPNKDDNPEFFVFTTNLKINDADTTIEMIKHSDAKNFSGEMRQQLADQYSARWGIETDYRVLVDEFHPKTTSNRFPIRYLLFFSGIILRNIWVLAQSLLASVYEKVLPGRILRARLFKTLLSREIDSTYQSQFISNILQGVKDALLLMKSAFRRI